MTPTSSPASPTAAAGSVRRSTPADAAAIREIAYASWRVTYTGLIGEAAREQYLQRAYDPVWLARVHARGDVRGFLALEGERPVGFAMLSLGTPADDPPGAVLRSLYLDPATQGKGHGKRLLEAVKQAAMAAGEPCLWVAAHEALTAARRWYEAQGFVYDGPASTQVGDEQIPQAVYRLPLQRAGG